jgi:succinoglycan biosynthesis protein ExoA
MRSGPEVSVLTPVRNEEANVRDVVAAMQRQEYSREIEFLFIDGRSRDRTREILETLAREDPRIRILDNPAGHTASALNIGLEAARGSYVARMDGHTLYPPHYLARGIERLEQGGVEWVAGPQLPVGDGKWSRRVALALESRFGTGGSNRWSSDVARQAGADGREVELRTGVFTGILRRETLVQHGGWDDGWPINQDSELAARVGRSGGRIVSLPELAAEYSPRDSLRELAKQYRRYGMYRAKTFLHHPESLRPTLLVMPGLVVATACSMLPPKPLRRPACVGVIGYLGAVSLASARAKGAGPRDAAALPATFVTMHGAWGAGFLAGLVRFAPGALRARRAR